MFIFNVNNFRDFVPLLFLLESQKKDLRFSFLQQKLFCRKNYYFKVSLYL